MLFTLQHSPFRCDLNGLLRLLKAGDDLLLLQDGVIAGLRATAPLSALQQSGATLYVLRDDVEARGLSAQIATSIAVVDYTDFVALAVKNPQQMAW